MKACRCSIRAAYLQFLQGQPSAILVNDSQALMGRHNSRIILLKIVAEKRRANFLRRTLVMKPEQIIYRRITPSFFVVSSVRNANIFYSRCNFSRRVKCFYIEYPAEQKRSWDRTVTRMSYSLR